MSVTERKLTPKGIATRSRILDAAAQLIFDAGIAETTVEDVRQAAGVSGSQLYHYFADKQALVRAVIEHQTDAVLDMQSDLFLKFDTMDGLYAWRDALINHQMELEYRGGCPIGTLGAEVAEVDDDARLAVAAGFARWHKGIADGLKLMSARGELAGDPDELALATLAAVQGGLLLTQIQRSVKPLQVSLDHALAQIAQSHS